MARKITAKKSAAPKAAKAMASTPVRNTAIPKIAAAAAALPAAKAVSHEMISFRAFEISRSSGAGSEVDNWLRAERELRGV